MATRSPLSPRALTCVTDRIEQRITSLFEAELARWQALDRELAEPLRSLRSLIGAGGKRLRPAFCYWGFVGTGGDPEDPRIVEVGAAFELLHAFALVHDDIMDDSTTRRNRATIHVELQRRHRAEAWRGEARRFGEGAAILVGNLAHVYADLLIDSALGRDPARARVGPLWQELRLEVNVGQYLDLLGTARGDRDPAVARRISRYKSGKYTVERPLELGTALADRHVEGRQLVAAYGEPLGEAFQLRDDVLGAFGDEAATGKPVGQDLREGKPTLLLAIAHARASEEQARTLDVVGTAELGDDVVEAVQQVLISTGALADVEHRIAARKAEAIEAAETSPVSPEVRRALTELAHFVADRTE